MVLSTALCCSPIVVVEYPTQHLPPVYWPVVGTTLVHHGALLPDAVMRSRMLVRGHVRSTHPRTMPLVDDQQVVQTFLPHRPRPALRNRMGFRCPVRRTHEGTTRGSEHRAEGRRKRGVPVVDQEAYGQRVILDVPAEVTCLLRDPRRRGSGGTAREADTPAPTFDEEEHGHGLQPDGFRREDGTRAYRVLLLREEGPPAAAIPRALWDQQDACAREHIPHR